jgi:hypothetical protein
MYNNPSVARWPKILKNISKTAIASRRLGQLCTLFLKNEFLI